MKEGQKVFVEAVYRGTYYDDDGIDGHIVDLGDKEGGKRLCWVSGTRINKSLPVLEGTVGDEYEPGDLVEEGPAWRYDFETSNRLSLVHIYREYKQTRFMFRTFRFVGNIMLPQPLPEKPEPKKPEPEHGDIWECHLGCGSNSVHYFRFSYDSFIDFKGDRLRGGVSLEPIRKIGKWDTDE